jgi:lysophospholipase L1-like esterase
MDVGSGEAYDAPVNPTRIAASLAAAVAVAVLAYAGSTIWHRTHLPAKPSVTESCRAAIAVQPDDILVIGDSIAALPEWHELLGTARVRNRARSGSRTEWLAAQNLPDCRTVILATGVNDLQARVDPGTTRANLAAIAARLVDRRVIVIPPMAPNLATFRAILLPHYPRIHIVAPAEAERLTNDLRAAMPFASIIDVSPLLGHDGRLHDDMTDDGLHPNGNGYITLGKILARVVDVGEPEHRSELASR